MKRVRLLLLPRSRYRDVLALQRDVHARVARGEEIDTWIVVEHEAVVTLGRNAKREHLLVSADRLASLGADLVEVERGGDVTYHGPGQVVVYPVMRLERFREVAPLVAKLELSVIDALGAFGVGARSRAEHRGVYVGENAICAVGLSVKQMTSMHGLALNVSTRLDYDRLILPCGTPQFGITSVERETGRVVSWEAARDALLAALGRRFDVAFDDTAAKVAS